MASVSIKPISATTWYTLNDVSFLQLNWEINRAGMLSVTVPVPQMRALLTQIRQTATSANTTTLAGMECKFSDEASGTWGGLITQVSVTDGMATLSAMSYEIVLRKKILEVDTIGGNDNRQHPGKVLASLIANYNSSGGETAKVLLTVPDEAANDPTFVRSGDDDVRISSKADAYDEIIPQLTEDIGYEWSVDANRKVSFMKQLGTNRSASVTLSEGVHVTSATWADDFMTVTNSLRGFCTVQTTYPATRKRKAYTVEEQKSETINGNLQSIQQFGILRERRDYPNIKSVSSLKKQLKMEVAVTERMLPLITVEVANVDNIWSRFRHGDTVRLELGYSDYSGNFRIMVRSLDVTRGVMVCSGYGDARVG